MKKFMTIWLGELISSIGSGMSAFAISVYVYEVTHSATWVSIVTMLAYLPMILLNPLGGILADRFDRRLMMICGDLFSAFGLLYIFMCIQSGHIGVLPISIGVTISSIFISLLEPSYKATVTDLLTEEEYAKASGLVQIAGASKYIISPFIAGLILAVSDIRTILLIDMSTIAVTVIAVISVRRSIKEIKPKKENFNLFKEFKVGVQSVTQSRGVASLVVLMTFMCFFIAFIQTLMIPMALALASSKTVGMMESISAVGMLVGSVVIGILNIKKNYAKILMVSLMLCGIFMALIGSSTNISFIVVSSILFFTMLPFVNTCADVLIRISIPNEVQGRAWGIISVITQSGYILAYAICGVLADYVFEPMFMKNGTLANSLGRIIGTGEGRGIGFMIIIAGFIMFVMAFVFGNKKNIKEIERIKKEEQIADELVRG